MTETVKDVMTTTPVGVSAEMSLADTARVMRDRGIGDVLVARDGSLLGIVTDRDIVVRALAEGRDPMTTPIETCCSQELVVVDASDKVSDVIQLIREKAIRRVPVTDDGRVVGIVSLGDLARSRDPDSALADVSAAPANT